MQEEKQHYLYVLVPENGDTFKIGISCGPLARFKGLQVSPDFALSRVYRGTRLAMVNLERALHATFFPWNAPWEKSAGGGHTEWFTRECLDKVLAHIEYLNDMWGGILERIKSNDLLQRPVDAACSFEKELDVTSIVTFKDDAGMRDVAYVSISGYEPDAIRAQCELLKAMFMLRTKYPWDTGRVCFPMEELTATIDSQLYHDNPEKFVSLLAGNGLNCVSGLGRSRIQHASLFGPFFYDRHGYFEAELPALTRAIDTIDFERLFAALSK
ncbi:TPA: GIY-YIG nuclease family protein [Escherichia coli]